MALGKPDFSPQFAMAQRLAPHFASRGLSNSKIILSRHLMRLALLLLSSRAALGHEDFLLWQL
jgi:hypothetical protein